MLTGMQFLQHLSCVADPAIRRYLQAVTLQQGSGSLPGQVPQDNCLAMTAQLS